MTVFHEEDWDKKLDSLQAEVEGMERIAKLDVNLLEPHSPLKLGKTTLFHGYFTCVMISFFLQ